MIKIAIISPILQSVEIFFIKQKIGIFSFKVTKVFAKFSIKMFYYNYIVNDSREGLKTKFRHNLANIKKIT